MCFPKPTASENLPIAKHNTVPSGTWVYTDIFKHTRRDLKCCMHEAWPLYITS